MIPTPHKPPLFPYTTLFRSSVLAGCRTAGSVTTGCRTAGGVPNAGRASGRVAAEWPLASRGTAGLRVSGRRSSGYPGTDPRSEEHTSELQSHVNIVCRLLLE